MTQPAISKHLKVLERAGLITRGVDAQRRPRRLDPAPLAEASRWLDDYRRLWEANFQRLDHVLHDMKSARSTRRRVTRTPGRPGRERRS